MNNLIQIQEKSDRPAVLARELYDFLGFDGSNWQRWYEKNIIYNDFAAQGEDWEVFVIRTKTPVGGRPTRDFLISLDFAKRLAMMSRTEKGEEARRYFIECERLAKEKLSLTIPRDADEQALALATEVTRLISEKRQLQTSLAEAQPKVAAFDSLMNASGEYSMQAAAQIMGIGRQRLFDLCRAQHIIQPLPKRTPYQRFVDAGYFVVKAVEIVRAERAEYQCFVTPKGLDWLRRAIGGVQ